MGNKSSRYKYIEELKPAEYYQLEDLILNLEKYVGSGETLKESLIELNKICLKFGIPEPERYGDIYYCGTIEVFDSLRIKNRLNPVFFKKRNNRYFAIIFYPKI